MSITPKLSQLAACPHCDLLLPGVAPPLGHTVACPRCGCVLARNHPGSLDKTLALSITGLLLYVPAILLPLITLGKLGMSEQGNVLDTIGAFYSHDYFFVAAMVLLSAVLLPACLLSLISIVALQLKLGKTTAATTRLFRHYIHLEKWAMVEVYLLGILITVIKMSDTVQVSYNSGFFVFLALVFAMLGITAVMDRKRFWDMIDRSSLCSAELPAEYSAMPGVEMQAGQAGLILCLTCNKLQPQPPQTVAQPRCCRCGDRLHLRKPHSLSRTLALVLISAFLLLPANFLPIMRVDVFGSSQYSTILDGIQRFLEDGSYLVGLIILLASILVPLFKIIGLAILLVTAKWTEPRFLREKSLLFRFISFIGRWSMLDIFVIALLIALVDFGIFTSIYAAPAATFFCLVVAATMLAANTFDPRIMWDRRHPQTSCTNNKPS